MESDNVISLPASVTAGAPPLSSTQSARLWFQGSEIVSRPYKASATQAVRASRSSGGSRTTLPATAWHTAPARL